MGESAHCRVFFSFLREIGSWDPTGSETGGGSFLLLIKAWRCLSQTAARINTAPGEE